MKDTDWNPEEIPGTEDFRLVIKATAYESYEWAEFLAWYSPSSRKYFWSGQSGCSCNMFEIYKLDNLENGSKQDMVNALRRFMQERDYYYSLERALEYLETAKRWRYSKEMPRA